MEIENVKIGNKEFKIKKLSFLDVVKLQEEDKLLGKIRVVLDTCVIDPKVTDDFLEGMTAKEGKALLDEINRINGWSKDFQVDQPNKQESQSGE